MWSVIGHAPALEALGRALASGSPAHAWLFSGPEGTGKGTAAIEFAAALNCEVLRAALEQDQSTKSTLLLEKPEPCGECRPCKDTLAGKHPDVELVAPGGICDEPEHRDHAASRDLRICQVRRLERVLSLSPYAGGRRVAIIDAADTLHVEAANAFLKTLEEPPGDSVIILLAERQERLPETVLSRCQRLAFRPLDRNTVIEALKARGAADEKAEAIASAAGGRIGWALRTLEDDSLLSERDAMLDEAIRLAHAGRSERLGWARGAENRAQDVRERYLRELSVWESWWRDLLLAGSGRTEGLMNGERAAVLAEEGKLYGVREIVRFLQALLETREYLHANVDPQLALETLTLDLPQPRPAVQV
jgi:DNA polymerase III subunit delta'